MTITEAPMTAIAILADQIGGVAETTGLGAPLDVADGLVGQVADQHLSHASMISRYRACMTQPQSTIDE
jgi:hypothetical protein